MLFLLMCQLSKKNSAAKYLKESYQTSVFAILPSATLVSFSPLKMLILQQMNVCVGCPSHVTDILGALLWSPLDESSGREDTLPLELCQSHAVVNSDKLNSASPV